MKILKKIKFKINKPKLKRFEYYPIIVYDNSYIAIKWEVRYAFFVHINNKIGFKRKKGEYFTLIKKGTKYKLKAFGFFSIKTFELTPKITQIKKKEIKAKRFNNEIKIIKSKEDLSIVKKTTPTLNTIQSKKLITFEKELSINKSKIEKEIIEIQKLKSINQVKNLKNKYYV